MSSEYEIIKPGNVEKKNPDYMCHEQLGGCGCIFRAKSINKRIDSEGDLIESYVICPTCNRKVNVMESSNPKGIQYGFIKY